MKAAFIEHLGSYSEIKYGELPVPVINSNEVLVKVQKIAVNFVDTFVRSGGFKANVIFPFVIGRDAVGTVSQIGSEVTSFNIGDVVWTNSMGYDGRVGVSSEYTAVPAKRLYKVPTGVDTTQLIAAVHSAATAVILLRDVLQVRSGQNILIEGGAGHVGQKLTEVAKILGLQTTTTSNQRNFNLMRELQVDHYYDYHQPVAEIEDDFDNIVDTSGKISLPINLSKLNLHGKIGMITAPKASAQEIDFQKFYTSVQSIRGFVISHATEYQLAQTAEFLNRNFSKGKLLRDEVMTLPLSQASEAQRMLETHQTNGKKLILTI
ncbi:quinone oxidoreductase family protein [Companilactobacillus sp. HBUAS56275]|uniref:Alcohol dehydrogenase catalytic domain-containing protein n=1 Tax=Candidatus Companilactobacillus pullicola TaxID=2838523 RepID=A0A9D2CMC3_9LACO|nr:alcohol dehydrogenase catalytic domain-containing protein [Candidatus Companilactobacillus pullicola]